jgi:F5/8 type C domain/Pectate lyase superfamily protein/Abnormal spindle-like microcephaly-assoc'd, ASPM-SPD-2-Hydin
MTQPLRSRAGRRLGATVAGTALLSSVLTVLAAGPAAAAATGGPGASLPYIELQAENAATTGTIIGPSASGVAYGTLADEASYRKAVTLSGQGQYVEFTTTAPTNSIDFRYSIPDGSGGSVYTSPISFSINGASQSDFTLTDAYSWYYGSYPFVNTPGSNPHHFYDEVHRLLPSVYPVGTKFRLTLPASAATTTIDFADFEQVGAALSQPAGSVSVTSQGADNTGGADATAAFNSAISAAGAGGTVWIPPGTYNIPGHIIVNNVTVAGAGMWYSTITGANPGFYGPYASNGSGMTPPGPTGPPSQNVHLSNFAIMGNVQERNDGNQVNGIGGALSNSTVSSIWIEHLKVGAWMDGPMDSLTFSGMRIRNTTADGINFHGAVTNSTVTNSDIRNTGDDGLATWADSGIGADANDSFNHDTVQYPILANGIAIYGGHDNTVDSNRVVDAGLAQGGGIHVGQRFTSTQVGKTTISNNTLIRDGSLDPNWNFGVGALWFDGSQGNFAGPVNVTNALIQQSPYEAVQWVEGTVSNVNLSNVTIQGAGTFALQEQTGGTATLTNVVATGVAQNPPSYNCEGGNFVITDGGGNSGITPTSCVTDNPTPVWPPYLADNNVTVTPTSLSFGAQATNTTSPAQTVTVSNNGTAAQTVSATVSGQFADSTTCGASLAASASCSYNVTFTPTTAGTQTGTLAVAVGGSPTNVSLAGTGVAPGPITNANPTSLSFASTIVGATTATQPVTITNSGTSAATVSGVSVTGDFTQTNNCSSLAVGGTCTVNVAFKPTAAGSRTGSLSVASNANNGPSTVSLSGSGISSSTNIAAGKPATASSSVNGTQVPGNATDADTSTYWESGNNAFPQWIQVDLGSSFSISKVVLDLPPLTAWATRTQTLSVQTSADGATFATTVASATYTFDPSTGNTVSITVPATTTRYVRVNITANSGWPAGQVSDFQVYPSGGGGTGSATVGASPPSLAFASTTVGSTSGAQSVTVSNTGTAAATVSGVSTTGDFAQTNTCGTSIAAGASCSVSVTFHPTATGSRTGTLTVSSNATNSPATVALSGTGTTVATATLSTNPSSLTFASTTVGSASAAQSVTVSNTGTAAATVSGIATSGDFTQTNTCGSSIAGGGSCTVSVTFHPSATGTRTGSLTVTSNATNSPSTVSLSGTGAAATNTNLALNKPTTESNHTQTYVSSNATDGNQATYWESVNNSWPAWLQVDLGSAQSVSRVVLQLPTTWGARNETLSILGSTDNASFTTLKASATYTFSPSSNTVTITFTAATERYIRVNITANTVQPGGQVSELQVWNS